MSPVRWNVPFAIALSLLLNHHTSLGVPSMIKHAIAANKVRPPKKIPILRPRENNQNSVPNFSRRGTNPRHAARPPGKGHGFSDKSRETAYALDSPSDLQSKSQDRRSATDGTGYQADGHTSPPLARYRAPSPDPRLYQSRHLRFGRTWIEMRVLQSCTNCR